MLTLVDLETIEEGWNLQHSEKRRLGGTHSVTRRNQLDVTQHLNGSSGNLRLNGEGLEERSLLGAETGVLRGHDDVNGSQSAGLRRSRHLVVQDLISDLRQIAFREHEADVSLDMWQQSGENKLFNENIFPFNEDSGELAVSVRTHVFHLKFIKWKVRTSQVEGSAQDDHE